jgi:membrane fusion protein (multidrug efflux system)
MRIIPKPQRRPPRREPQTKNFGSFEPSVPLPGHVRQLAPVLALCLMPLLLTACEKNEAPREMPPPEVEVTDVVQRDVPIYQDFVAQLNGPINAEITPKVQGYLLQQNYPNGFFVKKGQLLFEIDPRPFVASLDQAKAQVAVAEAQLSSAQTNVTRDTPLVAQNAIPQKQLDSDLATLAANKAQLDATKAQMALAQLNLAWTKVYSPIDGIAGNATSQTGDLVGPSTKMTTVSEVNPIWAYFNISEVAYLANAKKIEPLLRGRGGKADSVAVEYIQANDIPYPQKGRIILVNREITSQTGTIQLAAEFANQQGLLRPGGFGRVRIQTATNKNAMLIPQAAVIEIQSMYQVVVVGPDNKAQFRTVKVGDRVGTDWIIEEGLNSGDKVVVQGFMKVRQGMPVSPKPYAVAATAGGN